MYKGRAELYRPKLQRRTHSIAYIGVSGHTQHPCVSFHSYTPTGGKIEYIGGGAEFPQEEFFETNAARQSVWGHKVAETKAAP